MSKHDSHVPHIDETLPEFATPMMTQYLKVKKQYMDCILFFRMGDFYEMFLDDAKLGARILDITLTSRSKGKDGRIPMAGVPYHAVDSYLYKLVKAGYKVAICEQLTPPNKYGLVERDVIRIVTPGTVLDENALDRKRNNYIVTFHFEKHGFGMAIADISTGLFQAAEFSGLTSLAGTMSNELSRLCPAECVLSEEDYNNPEILGLLRSQPDMNIFPFDQYTRYSGRSKAFLLEFFNIKSLQIFDLQDKPLAVKAAGALLGYLHETQKGQLAHIKSLKLYSQDETMQLDRSTITNLELFSTIREGERSGSLLHVLDKTVTPMGGRKLRNWLMKPLIDRKEIKKRHEMVAELLKKKKLRTEMREAMEHVNDIERIVARLATNLANAKDLIGLKNSLDVVNWLGKRIAPLSSTLAGELVLQVPKEITEIREIIEQKILPEPAFDPKNGGIIKNGILPELDELRAIVQGGKDWIIDLETKERARTGISTLKVRFNRVFGFYIEISKGSVHLAPSDYNRKQTLVNGERFITPELKKQEDIILSAEVRINELEYRMFQQVVGQILEYTIAIQQASEVLAIIDCLTNFAEVSQQNHYTLPDVVKSQKLCITDGRHPVVEQLLTDARFVPNNTLLSSEKLSEKTVKAGEYQLVLLTGPNMAGKSVYIRQVALIVLMCQIGCFVPAEKAEVGVVDRIFVRSGASDVISQGLSTFMVEMVETSQILSQATSKSLIIMDEIGRGTSTFDGISIAWAVAEYLVTNPRIAAKTLFATHYHELQELEAHFPTQIRNMHMAVEEEKGKPVFLHSLQEGGAAHSFGIAVAELAGVPTGVTKRAKEMLRLLEKNSQERSAEQNSGISGDNTDNVVNSKRAKGITQNKLKNIEKLLRDVDINNTTPLQALKLVEKLKGEVQ